MSNNEKPNNKGATPKMSNIEILTNVPKLAQAIKKDFMYFAFKLSLFVFPIPIQAKIFK